MYEMLFMYGNVRRDIIPIIIEVLPEDKNMRKIGSLSLMNKYNDVSHYKIILTPQTQLL